MDSQRLLGHSIAPRIIYEYVSQQQRVRKIFGDAVQVIEKAGDAVIPDICAAARLMIDCINNHAKILVCGNGGSASDAQHFTSEMLNRFEMERPGLPALALNTDTPTLTSIANDYGYDQVFSKQVTALGNRGDVLLVITTSGNSKNILRAVAAAHDKHMRCVALNGRSGGELSPLLSDDDVDILVPGTSTARIQEVHGIVIHSICDLIDNSLVNK